MKVIGLGFVFFLISFSLQAQAQSKKDSLKAELNQLEYYNEQFKIRIVTLGESIKRGDTLIALINNKIIVLDSVQLAQNKMLEELEQTTPQTAEIKKAIKELKKHHADVGKEMNRVKDETERIVRDQKESKDDMEKAEKMIEEIRIEIARIRKELQD